jgi:hypothetical protein
VGDKGMMYACGHDSNGERNPEYEALPFERRMSMSSGQCPKCMELRNQRQSPDYRDWPKIKFENAKPVQVIGPDPEILAIMRLFLEKYEVLASADREMYSKAISSFANPPLAFDAHREK